MNGRSGEVHEKERAAAFIAAAFRTDPETARAGAGFAAADRLPAAQPEAGELRLGYFPNITQAQALYARATGEFERRVGARIKWTAFNAGPTAIEALFANAVDAAFVGPGPTINGFIKSRGGKLVIVAGSASGGAGLVVQRTRASAATKILPAKQSPRRSSATHRTLPRELAGRRKATVCESRGAMCRWCHCPIRTNHPVQEEPDQRGLDGGTVAVPASRLEGAARYSSMKNRFGPGEDT